MSDASFHARVTADVSQFKAEIASAAGVLASLVKASEQSTKVSPKAAGAKKAVSDIEDVYSKAQRAGDKLHKQNMQNIADEGKARSQSPSVAGRDSVVPSGRRTRAEGPVRDGAAQELRDLQKLISINQELEFVEKRRQLNTSIAFQEARAQAKEREAIARRELAERKKMNQAHAAAIREDARRAAQAQQKQLDAMVTGRYALYDLASSYDIAGRASLGLAAAMGSTVFMAGKFETAFTSVERALKPLPDEISSIKQQLIDLSTTMPVAFADITNIATLGAQMGIGASGIESFTKTIAAFSAVTGVTVEESAQSYGRIASLTKLPQDQFEKLGSAVLYAGNNAVATEQQILRMTESIAGATSLVGYTTDQTVGLATAFASLGIAPEAARGVITRVFADISRVVDTGGKKLEVFAATSGMTATEVKKLWAESPDKFFSSLLKGIGTAENFTKTMDALGFTETRETTILTKLSKNLDVVNKSMSDASMSFKSGTALSEGYEKTADNLESKIRMLTNALQAMADTAGSAMVGPLGAFIEILEQGAVAMSVFMKSPLGGSLVPIVTGVTAVTGVILTLMGMSKRATAQLFAMRTAMIQMGRVGEINGSFRELFSSMMGMTRAVRNQKDEIVFLNRQQAKSQGLLHKWEIGNIDASRSIRDLDGRIVSMTRNQAISAGVLDRWQASAKRATFATRAFGIAINTIGIASAVLAVGSLVAGMVTANEESKKLDLLGSGGGLASLREAIAKDTELWNQTGDNIALFQSKVAGTKTVVDQYATAVSKAGADNADAAEAVMTSTKSIDQQTVAIGKNTKEWIYNSIILNDKVRAAFEEIPNMMGLLEESGFDFGKVINDVIADPASADNIVKQIQIKINELQSAQNALAGSNTTAFINADKIIDYQNRINALEKSKAIAKDIAAELKKAVEWSKIVNQIKGFSPEFLGLDTILQGVKAGSDEYVAAINKIRTAAQAVAKKHKITIDFNGQSTVQGMIRVTKAAYLAEMAMLKLSKANINFAVAANLIKAKYDQIITDLQGIVGGTDTVADSAGKATTALEKLQAQILKTFSGTKAIIDMRAAVRGLAEGLSDSKSWSSFTAAGTTNLNNLFGVIDAIAVKSNGNKQQMANNLVALKVAMAQLGLASVQSTQLIDKEIKALGLTGKATKADIDGFVDSLKNGAKAIPLKEFKTALDYANDLGSVLKRAFDLRYGKQIALDEIWSQWNKLKEEADAAKEAINEANDALKAIQADKNILEYQLGIAVKYGDTKRADAIRAKIAEQDKKALGEQKKIAAAQEDQDKSLTGNSKAAVKNRATVRGLVSTYTDYLTTLAASGASSDELKAEAKKLAGEFLAQGQALGFSTSELETYTKAFEGDFTTAIKNLPSTVTLKLAPTDPIVTAIAEFVGKANAELGKLQIVDISGKPVSGDTGTGGSETGYFGFKDEVNPAYTTWQSGRTPLVTTYTAAVKAWETAKAQKRSAAIIAGLYAKVAAARAKITAWDVKKPAATVKTPITAATGGYISGAGNGTSDSIPAMLSNGEYVMRASAVSKYGVDFMNAINGMQSSRPMPASTGSTVAGLGAQIIHLSPEDRSLLRQAIDRPVNLYADSTKIAQSANAGNQVLAQRGSR